MRKKINLTVPNVYVLEFKQTPPEGTLAKSIVLIDIDAPLDDVYDCYYAGELDIRQATMDEFLYWTQQQMNPADYDGFKKWFSSRMN